MNFLNKRKSKLHIYLLLLTIVILIGITFFLKQSLQNNSRIESIDTLAGIAYPIDLGEGLSIVQLSSATGNYPEDGSDEFIENVLSARIVNNSDRTLQYATLNVLINDKIYSFSVSTLPPGKSLIAYETEKKSAPEMVEKCSAYAEYIVYFSEEPLLYEKEIECQTQDGYLEVKNITNRMIDREISVFYKNMAGGSYVGGITYRMRIPSGLDAGESVKLATTHMSKNATKVMFITYGNE